MEVKQKSPSGLLKLLLLIVLAVCFVGTALSFLPGVFTSSEETSVIYSTVKKGRFINEITEKGDISSSENKDVICGVQGKYTSNITILTLIAEGTNVKKGDWLCTLDSSKLEDQRDSQEVSLNNSEAAVVQAKSNLDTSKIAKKEYLEGTYVYNETQYKSNIIVKEEAVRRLTEYRDYSKKLFERGYVTALQLESDIFAVESAELDLTSAQTQLKVLQEFTKAKQIIQLDSDIASAQATLEAKQRALEVDQLKMKEIEAQIALCNVTAPQDGQVVYANESSRHGTNTVIEAGLALRERQVIFRLPNPEKMQVECRINEGKISMIRVGQKASIIVDSLPDPIEAEVRKVNEYAEPSNFFTGNIKEYKVWINIIDPPAGIRSGLTAQCKIRIEEQDDVLMLPVHCVFEHGRKFYAIKFEEGKWELREVRLGSSNDQTVVLLPKTTGENGEVIGLDEGEQVVSGAFSLRSNVTLPALTEDEEKMQNASGLVKQRAVSIPDLPRREASPEEGEDGPGKGGRGDMSRFTPPSWFQPGMDMSTLTDEQKAELQKFQEQMRKMGGPRGKRPDGASRAMLRDREGGEGDSVPSGEMPFGSGPPPGDVPQGPPPGDDGGTPPPPPGGAGGPPPM